MEEEWRLLPGLVKYEVSSLGRVRNSKTLKIRKARLTHDGYYWMALRDAEGKQRYFSSHGLVASAFIGPRPSGYEVNHVNGNKGCNQPWNLEYLTHAQNMEHATSNGLTRHGCLSDEEIEHLIENPLKKPNAALARDIGVHESTVSRLRKKHGLSPEKPNKSERVKKGRGRKIGPHEAEVIRERAKTQSVVIIAADYDLNRSNVYQILRREIWK